ncbi:toxin HipA [Marinobacterium zhoushanense]|uniref:Toxin HipA n=1 Tax=Marinobacterium zhoushanense TaxID=1679163 RepID=A0ABQ1KF21_9GAMM|nr:type II toxin-antitoxin system HipA family toxin [Marinobacterium zhoushanense]GGB92378.1 toxin HipA [Marinobacterium zhoushanense]
MVAKACQVEFDGIPVGTLAYTGDPTFASFEYDPAWIAEGFSISPLHMPLTAEVFHFPAIPFETFKGLPAAFSDSLPDDFGNALIDAWLARAGQDKANFNAVDRLLYTGTRGMGALEYQNEINPFNNPEGDLHLVELIELAQKVLNDREEVEIRSEDQNAMQQLLLVGTSAGGARPKAIIAVNKDRTRILSGQIEAPEGFEHYLLKFDGISEPHKDRQTFGDPKGYGLMEYTYYRMATECGIEMMPCELFRENGRAHFMTKRFDREENQKYHTLTLCGMVHADFKKPAHYSYEELLMVARQLNLTTKEQIQIFKRMVFNVIARNQDDHTKNTTFIVDDNLEWRLAPAYDIAFSYRPDSPWVGQHQMTINGKSDGFLRDDLLKVASLIPGMTEHKANGQIDEIKTVVMSWRERADDTGVFPELRDHIQDHLRLYI